MTTQQHKPQSVDSQDTSIPLFNDILYSSNTQSQQQHNNNNSTITQTNHQYHHNHNNITQHQQSITTPTSSSTNDVNTSLNIDSSSNVCVCRHLCGCRDRNTGSIVYGRECASKGSRVEHEQNPSLHPFCNSTSLSCYQYLVADFKPRVKSKPLHNYLPSYLIIDVDSIHNHGIRKQVKECYANINDLQCYQLANIYKQSQSAYGQNYYSSSDIVTALEIIRRQIVSNINILYQCITQIRQQQNDIDVNDNKKIGKTLHIYRNKVNNLISGNKQDNNNDDNKDNNDNFNPHNNTNKNLDTISSNIPISLDTYKQSLLQRAKANTDLPLLPPRCQRHTTQHRKCPIYCNDRWAAQNLPVPSKDQLEQIAILHRATMINRH